MTPDPQRLLLEKRRQRERFRDVLSSSPNRVCNAAAVYLLLLRANLELGTRRGSGIWFTCVSSGPDHSLFLSLSIVFQYPCRQLPIHLFQPWCRVGFSSDEVTDTRLKTCRSPGAASHCLPPSLVFRERFFCALPRERPHQLPAFAVEGTWPCG